MSEKMKWYTYFEEMAEKVERPEERKSYELAARSVLNDIRREAEA